MASLPIQTALPELLEHCARPGPVVLEAPPGAGKTTLVPLALLEQPWLAGRRILMLEPRRLAARAAAARMAELLGEPVGETVGYRVRFENRVSDRTRIEVITEGILTRRLQGDPELSDVGVVIFDEFHERHIHSDLGLALCLDVCAGLRDDLRLLLMSATLDGERLSAFLGAPRVGSEGRSYPVDVRYLPGPRDEDSAAAAVRGVQRALAETEGDILVFLPGAREIRRAQDRLAAGADAGLAVLPLYGNLPFEQQQQALRPAAGARRVILSTPIAETSLTIDGVSVVVDSGYMRAPRFEPRTGLTALTTVRISAASAEQRAGRAGRLGPGVCYRLWSESVQQGLVAHHPPEIAGADLAPLALDLAQWGVADAAALRWLDPPPTGAFAQAQSLLQRLGLVDGEARITRRGRQAAALAMHPRLASMLAAARADGAGGLGADLAAIVSEPDLMRGEAGRDPDLALRLEALGAHRHGGERAARRLGADPIACRRVERTAAQWRRGAEGQGGAPVSAGELLARAYPDRVAMRRGATGRFLLANGRGARMEPTAALAGAEFLVATDLDGAGESARIRRAVAVPAQALYRTLGGQIERGEVIRWDDASGAVVAREEVRFGALLLEAKPLAAPDPEAQRRAMLEGVRRRGLAVLPWDAASDGLRARVATLRRHLGEQWPDWSDAALTARLDDWLGPYLAGMSRLEHLRRLDLEALLLNSLEPEQRGALERLAPRHLRLPSGNRAGIDYTAEEGPVLAAKLQELFGLAETPRIGDGAIPLTLHLLSPARRPVQVTRDLRGFWERTYAQVRKELKGRYPKHPWPEDPWSAVATAGTKRRR